MTFGVQLGLSFNRLSVDTSATLSMVPYVKCKVIKHLTAFIADDTNQKSLIRLAQLLAPLVPHEVIRHFVSAKDLEDGETLMAEHAACHTRSHPDGKQQHSADGGVGNEGDIWSGGDDALESDDENGMPFEDVDTIKQ